MDQNRRAQIMLVANKFCNDRMEQLAAAKFDVEATHQMIFDLSCNLVIAIELYKQLGVTSLFDEMVTEIAEHGAAAQEVALQKARERVEEIRKAN